MKTNFRYSVTILVLLLCLVSAPSSRAQALWRKTEFGMSAEDILKQYPDAHADKRWPGDKNIKILIADEIDIADQKFIPMFTFVNAKLVEVSLRLSEDATSAVANVYRDKILTILRSKYGQELSQTVVNYSSPRTSTTWNSDKTTIELRVQYIGGDALLTISYSASLAKEADKL